MNAVDLYIILVREIWHDNFKLLSRGCRLTTAVTMRASTILVSEPLLRKHAVAKSGQTCLKQVCAAERTGSRSAFANATASLALALGANAGKAITDVPSAANIARARRDLIIWDADCVQADPAALGDHTSNNHCE